MNAQLLENGGLLERREPPKETKKKDFNLWFKETIEFNLDGEERFGELHEKYKLYLRKRGKVPETKSSFSRMLRLALSDEINERSVVVINNNGIVYRGINLHTHN